MKKELLIKFGEKVRATRLEQGLSQEDLADKAGVHRTYIGMIERADKNKHYKTYIIALRLLIALIIKIDDDFSAKLRTAK